MSENKIENLFLSHKNQYSKKRNLKTKNIFIAIGVILFAILALGIFFEEKEIQVEEQNHSYLENLPKKVSHLVYQEPEYDDLKEEEGREKTKESNSSFNRGLLIGSKENAQILGRVIATSKGSVPIRAKIINYSKENRIHKMDFKLKEDSLLLGKGRIDRLSQRLHITFHTLIIDEKKISIQANAFMEDGTFGLKGEFNSGEMKKYGSRFGANFVRFYGSLSSIWFCSPRAETISVNRNKGNNLQRLSFLFL